jgi:hypothetical protein
MQYNLQNTNTKWVETLALEAETAITHLHITEQDHYRFLLAKNIKKLTKNHRYNNKVAKHEWKIMNDIKKDT